MSQREMLQTIDNRFSRRRGTLIRPPGLSTIIEEDETAAPDPPAVADLPEEQILKTANPKEAAE